MQSSEKSSYEIIITVKKNNDFMMGFTIIDTNTTSLNSQLEFAIEGIKNKLEGKSPLDLLHD